MAWKKGDENSRILYQFINENGPFTEPRFVSDNDAYRLHPGLKKLLGEVFINWKDLRDDPIDGDQYFQKIDLMHRLWNGGVRIDPEDDTDFSARFAGEISGGLSVIWERGTLSK